MKFPFVSRKRLTKAVESKEEAVSKLKSRIEDFKGERAKLREEVKHAKAKEKNAEANLRESAQETGPREMIARSLSGKGIEIGALHFPLKVPHGTVVQYVDFFTREENIAKYPELNPEDIVETDFVCNGEKLEIIEDNSQDFVIANHMLEHCINPLGTLENFLRVLKSDGMLFISLPDKRFTFDEKRPITPFSHIKNDFDISREIEDLSAYEDWTTYVRPNEDPVAAHERQQNIHFHAWTQAEIIELFVEARRSAGLPLEIEWAAKNGIEFIVLMRKDPSLTPVYF